MDAIIGVVGTILGTILGWMLNSISKRGKIKVFVSSWQDMFQYNNVGSMVPSKSKEQTECYSYKLTLDIYNSSGDVRIMRNIVIAFFDDKELIYQSIPEDDDTRRWNGPMAFYDNITPLNIPPKTIIQLKLHNGSRDTDGGLNYIWNTKKIYLIYKDEHGREKKVLIKEEDYSHYFLSKRKC